MPSGFVADGLSFRREFEHHAHRDSGEVGMIAGEDKDSWRRLRHRSNDMGLAAAVCLRARNYGGNSDQRRSSQEVVRVLRRARVLAVTIPSFRDGLAKMLATAELEQGPLPPDLYEEAKRRLAAAGSAPRPVAE